MTDTDIQLAIFEDFLKVNLRNELGEIEKPYQDKIRVFVRKYFGREMKGETDRAVFRKIIEDIIKDRGGA